MATQIQNSRLIDGREYARDLLGELEADLARLARIGVYPGLATVLIGDDFGSQLYERRLHRLADKVGCAYRCERLPGDTEEAVALSVIGNLNADPRVSGILLLRPLPAHIDESEIHRAIDPAKDIESVSPLNCGLLLQGRPRFSPSTPSAAFHALDRYLLEAEGSAAAREHRFQRSRIVVIGRSINVGKPLTLMAFQRNATVSSCDIHTARAGLLESYTREADILLVSAGVPNLIRAEHVRRGVVIIDIGINSVEVPGTGSRLVGDVDFDSVLPLAEAVTPVPGGVGPITDVMLLRNAVKAASLVHAAPEDVSA